MEENLVFVVLGLSAVLIVLTVLLFRPFANKQSAPTISKKAKMGNRKGNAKAKETFYKDDNEKVPDEEEEAWQDDNLFSLKEGKERGVYMGDQEVEEDDEEDNEEDDEKYENWDKYY